MINHDFWLVRSKWAIHNLWSLHNAKANQSKNVNESVIEEDVDEEKRLKKNEDVEVKIRVRIWREESVIEIEKWDEEDFVENHDYEDENNELMKDVLEECVSIDKCSTNKSSFSDEYYHFILAFVLLHACNFIVCISYSK